MNTSKIVIAISLAFALATGFIFFGKQDHSSQKRQANIAVQTESRIAIPQTVTPLPTTGDNISSQQSTVNDLQNSPPWNSPAGYEHVDKWRESRGYFSDTDFAIYENYGIETIKQLAASGDVKALRTLAKIYTAQGEDPELIISTLRETAIHGSTEALILVGMIAKNPRHFPQFNGPDGDELYKKDMLESLAIFKAASIRGDREVDMRITEARAELTLSPEDDRYIEQRGAEIYKDMEEKRKALGLGPFDNSVPSEVNDYYDAAAKGFPTN